MTNSRRGAAKARRLECTNAPPTNSDPEFDDDYKRLKTFLPFYNAKYQKVTPSIYVPARSLRKHRLHRSTGRRLSAEANFSILSQTKAAPSLLWIALLGSSLSEATRDLPP